MGAWGKDEDVRPAAIEAGPRAAASGGQARRSREMRPQRYMRQERMAPRDRKPMVTPYDRGTQGAQNGEYPLGP